jgi:excisionase family DNA binding protein
MLSDVALERLTTTQAADLVGVSQVAVRHAILEGRLEGSKIGGVWYVDRQSLLDWRRHNRGGGPRGHRPWERVAAALDEYGPSTAEELSHLCDLHAGNVRKYLAILAKEGRTERSSDGHWRLATKNQQGAA